LILQFNGTKEELFVLSWIFITKTKTFEIAPRFFKDKTKHLVVLKKFWKRNKAKAFCQKSLRTDRKRFVSIQNFDLKMFTFNLFWNESSKTEASVLERSLIWHCYSRLVSSSGLKIWKLTIFSNLNMSYSMCFVSRIEIQKSIELGIHAIIHQTRNSSYCLKYFLLYAKSRLLPVYKRTAISYFIYLRGYCKEMARKVLFVYLIGFCRQKTANQLHLVYSTYVSSQMVGSRWGRKSACPSPDFTRRHGSLPGPSELLYSPS